VVAAHRRVLHVGATLVRPADLCPGVEATGLISTVIHSRSFMAW